jgi:hypothetical protein
MIGKKSVMTAVLATAALYAATPYVAIWSLARALQRGDERALEATIDWNAVRAGLKSDIADGIVGDLGGNVAMATPAMASNALPPFGASFMSGIAGSVVDREVTPQHLAMMVRQLAPLSRDLSMPLRNVRYAFFEGPASFVVSFMCLGEDADDAPLRLRLQFRGGRWMVTRAWVPQDVIDIANQRT